MLPDLQYLRPDGTVSKAPVAGADIIRKYDLPESDIYTVGPPNGWDPLKATDRELVTYGLPPRPVDPEETEQWNAMLARYSPVVPQLCTEGTIRHPWVGSYDSAIWSGIYATSMTQNNYRSVAGTFKQPTFLSSCPTASQHGIWVGLGGVHGPGLLQIGTDVGGPTPNSAFAFWEGLGPVAPPEMVLYNVPITPGHSYSASVRYKDATQGGPVAAFGFIDNNTGATINSMNVLTLANHNISEYYNGYSADAIDERSVVNGSASNFREPVGDITHWGALLTNDARLDTYAYRNVYMRNSPTSPALGAPLPLPTGSTFNMDNYWYGCQ